MGWSVGTFWGPLGHLGLHFNMSFGLGICPGCLAFRPQKIRPTKSKVQLYLALWRLGGRFGVVCGNLLGSFGITCSHLGDRSELWQDTTAATKSKAQLCLALWQLGGRFGVVCGDLLGSFGAPWPPFQHVFWPWNLSGDALEAISGGDSKKRPKNHFWRPSF